MSDTTPSDTSPVPQPDGNTPAALLECAQAAIKSVATTHAHSTLQAVESAIPTNAEIEPVYQFTDILSGQFDADEEAVDLTPPKRVLAPMPESPKLHKVLAQSGLGSRLEMEALILEGRISVNNAPAHIGQRVQWGDQVKVNGRLLKIRISAARPHHRLPQADRRSGNPRRSAKSPHRFSPFAQALPRKMAVSGPPRLEYRRIVAVYQFRRIGQPPDASTLWFGA